MTNVVIPIFLYLSATVISKCLALQESVCDAADLFLSLKYPPLLFICDTACGFVRHMDCLAPDVSEKLCGKFSGCFEVPDSDKSPSEVRNISHCLVHVMPLLIKKSAC